MSAGNQRELRKARHRAEEAAAELAAIEALPRRRGSRVIWHNGVEWTREGDDAWPPTPEGDVGGCVLPLYSSIEKLDGRLLEAARDLGANGWQRLVRIILPLTLPGIIAGCLLVFLPAMGMFYVSDLLGGAKHLLIGNLIKTQFLNSRDWPFGAAISVMLTVLMALLVYCYWRAGKLLSKKGELA